MATVSLIELKKVKDSLGEAIEYCENHSNDAMVYKLARDASIQRFEFCVELSWKLAKKLMGSSSATAKPVIREMLQNDMISDSQLWFDFIEARNKSSHTYDEEIAKAVYASAKNLPDEIDSLLESFASL